MNNVRQKRRAKNPKKISVDFDNEIVKETIIEAYKDIQKQTSNLHTPTEFLKLPLNLIFGALTILLTFFSLGFIVAPIVMIVNEGFNTKTIMSTGISIIIAALCGLFAYICLKTGREVEKETDKHYIVAYFSAIVSLVALIISLIGLVKAME